MFARQRLLQTLVRPLSPTARVQNGLRFASSAPSGGFRSRPLVRRTLTAARWGSYLIASSAVGLVVITGAIFVHDAFTYTEAHVDRVPVSPLALHPEKGGPKNLPIAMSLVDDVEDEEYQKVAHKPRLVIVGGGWGAVSVLQSLHAGDYHVTVISPDTYTTFTPLLPSAAVGTVQPRSLVEPLRKIVARLHGHFIDAKAIDLEMHDKLLEIEANGQHMYLPYDKLVIACGSVSSTHGVPGLENCFQLKTIADARSIRRRVIDNFEAASLPTCDPEERKRLLSFVVCGGGPTGVEAAAEIYDLCQEDLMNYYPKLLRQQVSIHVIQSREHILNTYSEAIWKYAEAKFSRDGVNVITNARVKEVHPDKVIFTQKNPDGSLNTLEVPANFVLWSTGIAMNPFTQRVSNLLPNQVHKKAIEVDAQLRVKGAPAGEVYAIGDCATIETSILRYLMELVDQCDKNRDGKIDFEEWEDMATKIKQKMPMTEKHLDKIRELFELYDSDRDDSLTLNELTILLQEIGNKITALPATAQVASQQGKYLGTKLSKLARTQERRAGSSTTTPSILRDEDIAKPFKYAHLGSLAYIGNAAVFDLGKYSFMGGLVAMYAWRSVYWSEQVSMRTRALLMIDWVIRGVWGRDLSRL
ncbi:mitochondrial NADH dehydrogenase [Heliocybe sulcata]|uniref:Mitochondrial NADH dehydrogenase n=1 Tax=Heliocybe sulcata TaxID=5364 RepID=A0A5C3NCW6_9AGAM|nr:mitochondrial NADH dehydrogenase [Heliocybe sulcata]